MSLPRSAYPYALAENELANAMLVSPETLALLARRRSTKIAHFTDPGPSGDEIDEILRLAARVPDHGKLGPWRFVVIAGDGRGRAGQALADVIASDAGVDDAQLSAARQTFARAPVCVMVVSAASAHPKIPEWEQQLSAGAACFAMLLSAHAMGYAGCWLTGWPVYDARARAALGLAEHERIAGFIHLGSAAEQPTERVRADVKSRVSRY
jgi:nitroreductase